MARIGREVFDRGTFHAMARSVRGLPIFQEDSAKRRFLSYLATAVRDFAGQVYAYCLMTNHFHVLLRVASVPIGKLLHGPMFRFAQRWNWERKTKGPVFDDRFKSIPCQSEKQLLAVARYIEYNPVKAGMVAAPEDYPWSSCQAYLRGGDGLTDTGILLSQFADPDPVASYRSFLAGSTEPRWPHDEEEEWRGCVEPEEDRSIALVPEELRRLAQEVARGVGMPWDAVVGLSRSRPVFSARRTVVASALKAGFSGVQIARLLGRSPGAIYGLVHRYGGWS